MSLRYTVSLAATHYCGYNPQHLSGQEIRYFVK
ncbi:MAG: hypothetical protein K0Q90_4713, partial [Paenibacillaceae bacterium]|nr:hypothetical protein [Paenibacillaceae bacterium]